MIENYLSGNFEYFAQYCRGQAGHYRGGRRARREAEIRAHSGGARTAETFESSWMQESAKLSCNGAPGLLGGTSSEFSTAAARREAYGPGNLP